MPAGYVHVLITIIIVMLINDGDGKHGFMGLENIWASHSWSQIEHIRSYQVTRNTFLHCALGIVFTAPPLLTPIFCATLRIQASLTLLPTPHHTTPHHTTPHHTTPVCTCALLQLFSRPLQPSKQLIFVLVLWPVHSSAEHTVLNAIQLAATQRSSSITRRPVE